jgi:hypothetical protein
MTLVRPMIIVVLALAATEAAGAPAERLSILLEFQNRYSPQSVASMQREVERVFQSTPVEFGWVSSSEAIAGVAGRMAVIRFQGECLYQPGLPAPPKGIKLAVTQISDGVVLPFSYVDCDQIAAFVEPAIRGVTRARADMLFGRAMGRVVAHELSHILSRSAAHGTYGVTEPALSVDQLTCDALPLGWSDWMGEDLHDLQVLLTAQPRR